MTLPDRKGAAPWAEMADKALALEEIATQINRYLPPDSGISREEVISKIIGIIETRTNYLFLRHLKFQGRDREAGFRMMAGERSDVGGIGPEPLAP